MLPGYFTRGRGLAPPAIGILQARESTSRPGFNPKRWGQRQGPPLLPPLWVWEKGSVSERFPPPLRNFTRSTFPAPFTYSPAAASQSRRAPSLSQCSAARSPGGLKQYFLKKYSFIPDKKHSTRCLLSHAHNNSYPHARPTCSKTPHKMFYNSNTSKFASLLPSDDFQLVHPRVVGRPADMVHHPPRPAIASFCQKLGQSQLGGPFAEEPRHQSGPQGLALSLAARPRRRQASRTLELVTP